MIVITERHAARARFFVERVQSFRAGAHAIGVGEFVGRQKRHDEVFVADRFLLIEHFRGAFRLR